MPSGDARDASKGKRRRGRADEIASSACARAMAAAGPSIFVTSIEEVEELRRENDYSRYRTVLHLLRSLAC